MCGWRIDFRIALGASVVCGVVPSPSCITVVGLGGILKVMVMKIDVITLFVIRRGGGGWCFRCFMPRVKEGGEA